LDYDSLKLFVHLAGTLHFGRTSRACHVSPSALSRTIQRLEAEVGQPLFERDRRSVELTSAGRALASHATATLADWARVSEALSPGERLRGEIRIFASVTACQSFLPDLLSRFRSAHPEVYLRLETGYAADALGRLSRGTVDMSVAGLPETIPASMVAREVVETPLVFVAPNFSCEVSDQVEADPVPWNQVPLVLPATGLARGAADRWLRAKRVEPLIYGEMPGNEAILSLVALGCGVGIVPALVADKSPLREQLNVLSIAPALAPFRVGVCTLKRKLSSPLVNALWASLSGVHVAASGERD